VAILAACGKNTEKTMQQPGGKPGAAGPPDTTALARKDRVLVVNSYHAGFGPNRGLTDGILGVFDVVRETDGSLDCSRSDVTLDIFYMDTKRNPAEEYKRSAALRAKALIDSWKPDVVIATEDNAARYCIAPYFKNTTLPVVFCGINWDASVYGFPCENVTGMIEVHLLDHLVELLKPHATDSTVIIISSDTESARKSRPYWSDMLPSLAAIHFTKTFAGYRTLFLDAQRRAGIVIVMEITSLHGFSSSAFARFMTRHARVPTGGISASQSVGVLATCAQVPEEMGRWAAHAARRILDGTPPAAIPVAQNKRAKIYLNMAMARKMGIVFPGELIEVATFTETETGP
jgi:hypothetical protein